MKFWRKKAKDKPFEWFLENGSIFLQQLIADCNGKSIPIRFFSSDQILKATNNFDLSCYVSGDLDYTWYKGIIGDRFYLIKKLSGVNPEEVYNDIVISARVSGHTNFLKLLGCCLEFPLPVLVFEFAENGALNHQGAFDSKDESSLPWHIRLKIAKGVANAVTYLHTAFPRIIIHRDITPANVFVDKNWTAKLSGFSFSISLPEGKSGLYDLAMGTFGYVDPSHLCTAFVAEYTDVFSFGIFFMVLLIGRPAIFTGSCGSRYNIRDYVRGLKKKGEVGEVAKDFTACQILQMETFLELSMSCCTDMIEERPKMLEVAKKLKQTESSLDATSLRTS